MTDFRKWKIALIAGVSVPALALAGCSSDEDSGSSGSDGADTADSTDSADEVSDSGSDSGSDVQLEGAPDGFELTEPGSRLDFGEVAYVVTQRSASEGDDPYPLQFWSITANDPEELGVDEVQLGDEEDKADIENFVCLSYDVEFLGMGESDDPEVSDMLTTPDMGAVDDNGRRANTIIFGGADDCGIHDSDSLPHSAGDAQDGKVYQDATLSYAAVEEAGGVSPTGLAFRYGVDADGLQNADDIYWN